MMKYYNSVTINKNMRKQMPYLNKQFFPGGVTDLIDRKPKGIQTTGPILDKTKNIDLGDILSFDYIGRELIDGDVQGKAESPSDRIVLNPLVVFAGYDTSTQSIMGVDLKRFTLDKQVAQINVLLYLLRKIYYYQEESNGIKVWRKHLFTEVPYTGALSFRYENFGGTYSKVGKLLVHYFKSYKPKLMRQVIVMPPDIAEIEAGKTVRSIPRKPA